MPGFSLLSSTPRRLVLLVILTVVSPSLVFLLSLLRPSQVAFHYVLSMVHSDYSRLASFANLSEKWQVAHDRVFNASAATVPPSFLLDPDFDLDPDLALEEIPTETITEVTTEVSTTTEVVASSSSEPTPQITSTPKLANATFVFLCRNSDLSGVISSIRQMEDRFNKNYGYPWVLLNEEPFTEEFMTCVGFNLFLIKYLRVP